MSKIRFVNYKYIFVVIEVKAYNRDGRFKKLYIDIAHKIKSDVYEKHEDDIIYFLRNNVDYLDNYLYNKRIRNLYYAFHNGISSLVSYKNGEFDKRIDDERQLIEALKDENYRKIYVHTEDIYKREYNCDLRSSLDELIDKGLVTEIEVD